METSQPKIWSRFIEPEKMRGLNLCAEHLFNQGLALLCDVNQRQIHLIPDLSKNIVESSFTEKGIRASAHYAQLDWHFDDIQGIICDCRLIIQNNVGMGCDKGW